VNNFFNFFFEVLVANRSEYLRKNKPLGVAVGLPRATKEVLGQTTSTVKRFFKIKCITTSQKYLNHRNI
ncbi:MAG: hypothetical protein CL942_15875, partial [Desulfovibrio sp.]|nr:hypothetical protein [Desulfovibrio sp.]